MLSVDLVSELEESEQENISGWIVSKTVLWVIKSME